MKSIRTGLVGLTLSAAAVAVSFTAAPAQAQNPKACMAAVGKSSKAAGLPAKFATQQNVATACKRAKSRPALALRNFSHAFVMKNKVEDLKPAPAELGKQCPGRLNAVSKTLRINPKFANKNDIVTACRLAKGRPVLATRNFLDRFVVTAKIGPSVRTASNEKKPQPKKPPQKKPANAAAKCGPLVAQVAKHNGINPKIANEKRIMSFCNRAKGRPALASSQFLNEFIKRGKITPVKPKPVPAKIAKQCPGRLLATAKTLNINPKFANKKDIVTACKRVKGKPALASRNFLARFIKTVGIK